MDAGALRPPTKPAVIATREVAGSFAEASALDRAANRELPAFAERIPSGRYRPPDGLFDGPGDRAGNAIDDGFRDGTHDFGRK